MVSQRGSLNLPNEGIYDEPLFRVGKLVPILKRRAARRFECVDLFTFTIAHTVDVVVSVERAETPHSLFIERAEQRDLDDDSTPSRLTAERLEPVEVVVVPGWVEVAVAEDCAVVGAAEAVSVVVAAGVVDMLAADDGAEPVSVQ